jgi:microcompartment protein CcmK/EutM
MSDELKPLLIHHSSLITSFMIIARIVGTVVSSQKDERLLGKKLLIVRPINLDGSDTSGYVVAVDTVGAGFHERVLVVAGSSARLAQGMKDVPVDAAIVGVIDTVDIGHESGA